MIHGMKCRETIPLASFSIWFSLALTAGSNAQSLIALQSTPKLNVFVYGFPRLSRSVVQGAETEAVRMLGPVPIGLKWVDCTSRVPPESCRSPHASRDLIVRFLPKALPQASAKALGIAGDSADYATAFIFYDRISALRTHTNVLPAMLGRVLAHEITHLLLPEEDHAAFGLMRGQWRVDDLLFTSTACHGLSAQSVQFMQREAVRRMNTTEGAVKNDRARTDQVRDQTQVDRLAGRQSGERLHKPQSMRLRSQGGL
jgi:hypothetical protein